MIIENNFSQMTYLHYLLIVSNVVAIALFVLEKRKFKKRKPDITAQELLSDILSSGAVVKIQVIDPSNLILRSPRG